VRGRWHSSQLLSSESLRTKGARRVTFKVGQKVVYPNHGVTVVEDIATSFIDGAERTCYHLRLLSSNSKVMVPKDNLDLVGLRPLCEVKEIRNVLGILENGSFDAQKDWKGR